MPYRLCQNKRDGPRLPRRGKAGVGGRHGRHPVVGHKIAEFISDEDVPRFIETIISWYEDNGKEYGRTRIGTILQIPEKWNMFIRKLREQFVDKMVKNPK